MAILTYSFIGSDKFDPEIIISLLLIYLIII